MCVNNQSSMHAHFALRFWWMPCHIPMLALASLMHMLIRLATTMPMKPLLPSLPLPSPRPSQHQLSRRRQRHIKLDLCFIYSLTIHFPFAFVIKLCDEEKYEHNVTLRAINNKHNQPNCTHACEYTHTRTLQAMIWLKMKCASASCQILPTHSALWPPCSS